MYVCTNLSRALKRGDQIFTKDELKIMVQNLPCKLKHLKKVYAPNADAPNADAPNADSFGSVYFDYTYPVACILSGC